MAGVEEVKALAALFPLMLAAQTSLPVQQIRGAGSVSGQVFVVLPSGSVSQAMLDTAFTLDTTGPYPVLRVSIPPAVRIARLKVVVGVNPSQNYQLAGQGITAVNLLVFRNGVLQSEGDDYTFSENGGAMVGFIASAIKAGDIVQLVAIL